MRNSAPDAGFTLIEMIVVVLVLGLIGTMLIARGPLHSTTLDLRGAAQSLALALRQARMQAIVSGAATTVTIDPVHMEYAQGHGARQALPRGVALAAGSATGVTFYPDGSASGARLALVEQGRQVTLRTNWLTGAVTVDGP
ncbi:prepilin-type N-terminal cleavage/methylation domain-containing protein [Gluconacetobacter azotocaptans]|uniref:Type II secretion system protein H n=1 Tax=Gluconacetobacter azotocaptans TaxID=142834 RepID=A0A7W4JU91_9PROT|nr:GspH/FimT family pseudopilin [Gluconacetobacter azotocaptans]MBB2191013.1 prepilin-type N-terminal cleavage/methylation domain-containing protein [Gluconacetobacter azotocaptans]MBM9401935.1 GspH/FimT family pseudopilin [Gluconacetobacter azotocaptans]GBQ31435.1 Tfp pilus assembly protein FimT [Gluconacetobacter azotocaptans DSM 13594]